MAGSLVARARSRLIFCASAVGRPLGANRPNQGLASKPSTGPAAATVGTLGKAAERPAEVTASALSLPERTNWIEAGRLSNITSTLPPIRSASAGLLPL